jgi:hypothetical protein
MGRRNAENPDASLSSGSKILIGTDRASTDEDQREGADELREEFLRQTVQRTLLKKVRALRRNYFLSSHVKRVGFYWIHLGESKLPDSRDSH